MPNQYVLMTAAELAEMRGIVAQMFRKRFGQDSRSDDDVQKDIQHTTAEYDGILKLAQKNSGAPPAVPGIIEYGVVRPGLFAPAVKLRPDGGTAAEFMRFGFPSLPKFGGTYRGPVMEYMPLARSESVTEKRTFAEHALVRRCAVPAMGYIEKGILHTSYDAGMIYFAGIYQTIKETRTGKDITVFCILTSEPEQPEVRRVHDRMLLILTEDKVREWLNCGDSPVDVQFFIACQKAPLLALVNKVSGFKML